MCGVSVPLCFVNVELVGDLVKDLLDPLRGLEHHQQGRFGHVVGVQDTGELGREHTQLFRILTLGTKK